MMKLPKISIVTPSYNQGRFLEETILSVIDQGYPNLEYIIIDGGSSDNSVEIIKKYEKHLFYWVSEKDKGQSHAINKGIKLITGDVFNWLCSDDTLTPGSLLRIGEAFARNPSLKCYAGGLHKFRGTQHLGYYSAFIQGSFENTLRKRIVKQPSVFFSKAAVDKMGLLNERLHYLMDADWILKYLLLFGIADIFEENDFVTANYRLHPESKSVMTGEMFTKEYASILLSIARNAGMKPYEYVLEKVADGRAIEFPAELVVVSKAKEIEHLLFWFCIRKACMIYTKTDFEFAQVVLEKIDFAGVRLFEDEIRCVDFLNRQVRNQTWLGFRLKRAYEWWIRRRHLSVGIEL